MNFLKSKFVVILTILITIIISGGFFVKKQINKNFLDFIDQSLIFKENIKLGKIKYNFSLLKNEIEISNVSIDFKLNKEKQLDFYRQIYISKLKIYIGFFQVFQSIFQKNIKIKKIILENPSFNIDISEKNYFFRTLFFDELKKIKTSIEIIDGYLKIQRKEESLNQIFDKINGNFVINSNQLIKTKLIFKSQENFYEISGKIQNLKNNFYDLKFSLHNENNSLDYLANIEINELNQKITSFNGEIESYGEDLNAFINFFFISDKKNFCENQKIQENKMNNLKFQIKAKTIINENFLKINDIRINLQGIENENRINGSIAYDFLQKKIYTNFNAENLDLRNNESKNKNNENLNFKDIFEKVIDQRFSIVKNYFLFLKQYQSENFFDFKNIILSEGVKINNFNSEFFSTNENFIIKNFKLKINDIYDLKIKNAKNSTNSEKIFKITIDKNQMNFFELDAFFIDSNLIIENFKLITTNFSENQIKKEIIGKIKIKLHNKSNFISGDLVLKNINFNQDLINNNKNQELQEIFKYFEIRKDQTGGDFVKKILFLTERFNIFYDIKLKFENFNFYSHNLENFELKIFIKNNKIISSISGQNLLIGKFQINTLMMFKDFKPYLETYINIEKFFFNKFTNEFFKNSIFLTEKEFKENNDQNIWRNFNFNLNPIKNLETQIEIKIKNSKINDQEIQNIYSKIKSVNNILNVDELEIEIDKLSSINFSMNLEIEKMLFKGSFETRNLNYKNLLDRQLKSNNNQLFLSSIDLTSIGKFSTAGQNFDNFIQNFNGNIRFYGQNAIFNKIDINNFIDEFDNAKNNNKLISLTEQSVINGETIFDEIKGNISIRNNVIENVFDFSSKNFNGAGSLNMFLKNFTFKGLLRFVFFSKKDNQNLNFFDLNINGNFFNVNKTIDINSIKKGSVNSNL